LIGFFLQRLFLMAASVYGFKNNDRISLFITFFCRLARSLFFPLSAGQVSVKLSLLSNVFSRERQDFLSETK
jgi:hypothetical protein